MRTFLYKMTSDRGGAPCAPPPTVRNGKTAPPLLTLAICKPAIRRTAQPGDRILGITSRSLELREGYPPAAVIYAATVAEAVDARDYYAPRSGFRSRPDCIYQLHRDLGEIHHNGQTALHADPAHALRDLGRYPFYRNGRILLCREFRYFGSAAVPIPAWLPLLHGLAEALGQGHRVFADGKEQSPAAAAMLRELDGLWRSLFSLPTRFTGRVAEVDAYEHRGRGRAGPRPRC